MALGVLALTAPLAAGTWSLQFLGLFPLAIAVINLYGTLASPQMRTKPEAYASSILAAAASLLLLISPSLVASGVMGFLLLFLAADGAIKIARSATSSDLDTSRLVLLANGIVALLLTLAGWWVWKNIGLDLAAGVLVGGYTVAAGWSLTLSPLPSPGAPLERDIADEHPDRRIAIGPHPLFSEIRMRLEAGAAAVRQTEIHWLMVCSLILFVVHLSRMRSGETWLGLISPVVATAGDALMALVLGALVVLPLRLLWRRMTRPIERAAWQLRLSGDDRDLEPILRALVHSWTETRYSFSGALRRARATLPSFGSLALRLGLPLALLLAAVNPIWGFSWYFNTESWASGFYQKVTQLRVDTWRERMAAAVTAAYAGEQETLFRVSPQGTETGDFRFLVIGDPGEGDPSQYSLMSRYLELGRAEDVKFLIISSDVIYPAGAMSDYERCFYMPYKGWTKPVYALPGNHDWFDALEGFNANFLEPKAARAALQARVSADLHLTATNERRINTLITQAQSLRRDYGIEAGLQRGPYFEIQTRDFALIAIDTGILRTIDERQSTWLDAALERAKGKFIMALVGHPKLAGGVDTSVGDPGFAALYDRLEAAGARVLMAGDSHAFEHYLMQNDGRPVHYFVNGGGGAYLTLGGALAWPGTPAAPVWEFYPPADSMREKLDAETPAWKWPFWMWIKTFGAWPISIEVLSAMFDFNRAPFYQSFMEVRVERSRNRVVLALHGANGPLRWRDVARYDWNDPAGRSGDGLAEYVLDLGKSGS